MRFKNICIDVATPLLRLISKYAFSYLKDYCAIDDKNVANQMRDMGFHYALYSSPYHFFTNYSKTSYDSRIKNNYYLTAWCLKFINKIFKIRALENDRGRRLLYKLSVTPEICKDNRLALVDKGRNFIYYKIPMDSNPIRDKIVIYTVITGTYDDIHEPLYKEQNADYVLFTNNKKLASDFWEIRYVDEMTLNDKDLSRHIKMHPHIYLGNLYDVSIYVDGSLWVYGDLSSLSKYLGNDKSLCVTRHCERHTVKEEVDALIKWNMVEEQIALNQYEKYKNMGFPDDMGLVECTILVRKHNDPQLIRLMELWWQEYMNGAKRDQISLLPCVWNVNFSGLVIMDGMVFENQFCKMIKHN